MRRKKKTRRLNNKLQTVDSNQSIQSIDLTSRSNNTLWTVDSNWTIKPNTYKPSNPLTDHWGRATHLKWWIQTNPSNWIHRIHVIHRPIVNWSMSGWALIGADDPTNNVNSNNKWHLCTTHLGIELRDDVYGVWTFCSDKVRQNLAPWVIDEMFDEVLISCLWKCVFGITFHLPIHSRLLLGIRNSSKFAAAAGHCLPDGWHCAKRTDAAQEVCLLSFPLFSPAFHLGFSSEPLDAVSWENS